MAERFPAAPTPQGDAAAARPAPLDSGVIGVVLFLFTEAMIFAALISAFIVLKARAVAWPPPGQPRLPVEVTGINTLVLLASGWTMARAVDALRRGRGGAAGWLQATAGLGVLFLLVQGYEWARLLGFGLTGAASVYGATFYAIVGIHALHVLAAILVLAVNLARTRRGFYTAESHAGLVLCRMYWVFVVAVWPILYLLLYQPWTAAR
jgi:heme/copper-type cytochrome/quinol oxidase subunit 3